MPVYLHPANLIVNKKAVAEKYKGGIEQFRRDFEKDNVYFTEDNELFSLARMNIDEFPEYRLVEGGLQYDHEEKSSNDYVIISRYGGQLWEVDWLEASKVYAYHKDCSMGDRARVIQMELIRVDELKRIFDAGGGAV